MTDDPCPQKKVTPDAAAELPQALSAEELRRQAEERLDALFAQAAAPPAPEELAAAVHELRVHQIELEMQNEELRRAQLELGASRAQYFELFDRAPVGYLTLNNLGIVGVANFTAAQLLGVQRRELVGLPFSTFILAADRRQYYRHLELLKQIAEPQSCELRLQPVGGEPFWASLESGPQGDADGEPLRYRVTFADVDDRVRAEVALAEREEQLASAVEGSGVGLWDWRPQTCEAMFNERWAEIAGYTLAELAPTSIETWRGLCHPDDLRRADELLEAHFAGQSDFYGCETRLRHRDGHWVWVLDRGKIAEWDSDGRPLRMIGTRLDVTARRRAEHDLREREQGFRTFVETVDDIIVVATPDGRLMYANPTASTRLGYSSDELTGMQLVDLYPAEKRGEAAAILAALGGSTISCSLPLQSASEALVPVATRLWLSAWDGAVCVVAFSKDLTREQEALQKFERLFHGSPAIMALTSVPEGRFTEVNEAFLDTLAYSREEVIGHTPEELGLFVEPERQRAVAAQLQAHGRVSDHELEVRCKDGTILDGLFSGEIVESQAELYLLTVMVDETERKRAQQRLRASEEQLDRAVEGSGAGLWDWQVQSGEAEFNERWAEIVGYTLAELAPLSVETWTRLCHPDDLRRSNELLDEHFSGRLPRYKCEARMRHKNGHWVWVLTRGKVSAWDGAGRPLRISGTHLDISERKAIEEDIARALSLLESTMESTADGILVADGKGAMLRFNARFAEIWSIPAAIIASHDDDAAFGFVFDQLTEPERFLQTVRDLYASPEKTSFDVLELKDGRVLERYSQPQRIDDSVVGRVWSFRDITERKRAHEALRESEEKFRTVADFTYDWEAWRAPDGTYRYVSPSCYRISGHAAAEFIADPGLLVQITHPDDRSEVLEHYEAAAGEDQSQDQEIDFRIVTPYGETRWIAHSCTAVYGEDGQWLGRRESNRDITARKQTEEALRDAAARLALATRAGGVGLWDYFVTDDTLVWDDQMLALYGITREQFGGAYEAWQAGIHPADRERGDAEIQAALRGEKEFDTEFRVLWPDGTVRDIRALALVQRDASGRATHMIGTNWDVTAQRRAQVQRNQALTDINVEQLRLNEELVGEGAVLEAANATITRVAATDDLTGLANRRHFYEVLEKAVSLARRHGSPLSVVGLDLDGLKRANDAAGHEAGDEVLASFAALLIDLCRAEDLPARLGGDEFSVLLPGMDLGGALGLVERLLTAVRTCAALAQRGVTVSAGVAQWTPGELADDLLRRADDALYAAKRGGGDAVTGGA